jgi:hypothetical protein
MLFRYLFDQLIVLYGFLAFFGYLIPIVKEYEIAENGKIPDRPNIGLLNMIKNY